jgi:hypothetical protein
MAFAATFSLSFSNGSSNFFFFFAYLILQKEI